MGLTVSLVSVCIEDLTLESRNREEFFHSSYVYSFPLKHTGCDLEGLKNSTIQ